MMKMKNIIPTSVLPVATVTAGANGAQIDVREYIGDIKITLDSSAGAGADNTMDVKLQESDDGATWTDVTGGVFTQVTNAGPSFETLMLSVDGFKRYIRGVDAIAGTGPEFSRSLSFVGQKQYSA